MERESVAHQRIGLFRYLWEVRFAGTKDAKKKRLVALSFDDGPHSNITLQVLRILNTHVTSATFFWIVKEADLLAKNDPKQFQAILTALRTGDHEVGLHAPYDYRPTLRSRLLGQFTGEEMTEATKKLRELTGMPVTLYRPHYFQFGSSFRFANELGLTAVLWNPFHYAPTNWSSESQIRQFSSAKPGNILLFHDGVTSTRPETNVLEVLPQVLVNLKRRDLYPTSVSKVL